MNFKLRAWEISDLDNLVKHANNPKIAGNMTDQFPHPYTAEAGQKFIQYATGEHPSHILAIEVNGEACGGIGIHPQTDIHRKNAELGYWLAEPYWGNGIVPKAIKEMVTLAFKQYDIERLFARPFGSNLASQKVLEKCGFKLEARLKNTIWKNGHFDDELIYAIWRTPMG